MRQILGAAMAILLALSSHAANYPNPSPFVATENHTIVPKAHKRTPAGKKLGKETKMLSYKQPPQSDKLNTDRWKRLRGLAYYLFFLIAMAGMFVVGALGLLIMLFTGGSSVLWIFFGAMALFPIFAVLVSFAFIYLLD